MTDKTISNGGVRPLDDAPESTTAVATKAKTILPGSTIGMVGGGQLGRMFSVAATRMGYDVVVFCASNDEPAAQVSTRTVVGRLDDSQAVIEFARQCDVISLEFENIPAETMRLCGEHAPTHPSHHVLATAQDRLIEKQTFADAGLAVTPFARVTGRDCVQSFAAEHGWPVIVKTARSGYDGKGQHRLDDESDIDSVPWQETDHWIAEKCIEFQAEASIIVARSAHGEVRCFPPFENHHVNHILDTTVCPSFLSPELIENAVNLATKAAEVLDLVGVLCVELFVTADGTMLINEVAPRPHNSGHLTIEACHTSQFEQHVRAVCGMPLGDPSLRVAAAAMANLLGDLWPNDGPPAWDQLQRAQPTVALHLYGKRDPKVGRKMGHLTATADSVEAAREAVLSARRTQVN
ncbi:5-(carboxyamino)imidazole ribonucleotide synthase [Roseiconus lacunae]|uniref:5-(carboxyamino)imidazole ribonucleotide synthase n=1 Tax=Roseiconus lacunae TaxID=2605694 RepID=UPI003093968B|nr:5-(carboxyamino)imidazole ribonucleotide synthase [Stieleria sp. HD01]